MIKAYIFTLACARKKQKTMVSQKPAVYFANRYSGALPHMLMHGFTDHGQLELCSFEPLFPSNASAYPQAKKRLGQ